MNEGEQTIKNKWAAVERLAMHGGGVEERSIGDIFVGKDIFSLFAAIESGLIIHRGDRLWIRPSVMFQRLSCAGVLE